MYIFIKIHIFKIYLLIFSQKKKKEKKNKRKNNKRNKFKKMFNIIFKYCFFISIIFTNIKMITSTSKQQLRLEQTPLYSFSKQQDPMIAKFIQSVEMKFFKRSSNISSLISGHLIRKKKSNEYCANPDQDYLESILSEYQVHYRKFEETVLKGILFLFVALFFFLLLFYFFKL